MGAAVLVEQDAGARCGFANAAYREAGARILSDATAIFEESDLILRVKEPQPAEYALLRPGQALFTFLHLAAAPRLAEALKEQHVLAMGYETVEKPDGDLPILKPMSQIAGRLAVQVGASCLQTNHGGRGILLGSLPGAAAGHVVVLGAGNAGSQACHVAAGMGARVSVLDLDNGKLRALEHTCPGGIHPFHSNPDNVAAVVPDADLLIGAVLVPGNRAPTLVSASLVRKMRPGSAIVDIAVDQGGCVETIKPTTIDDPTYERHGIIHYGVANMPALAGRTATFALSHALEPYLLAMAREGIETAIRNRDDLSRAVNVRDGRIVHPAIAKALDATCARGG